MCGKSFFLLLAVFLLLSQGFLFAEVTLTDEEFNTIMTALTEAENSLTAQETKLSRLEELSKMQERTIAALKMEYELQRTFYEKLKKDQMLEKIRSGILWFLAGGGVGAIATK